MPKPTIEKLVDNTAVKKSWEAARLGNGTGLVESLEGWLPRFARRMARRLRSPINDEDDIAAEVYIKAYKRSKTTGWRSIGHFLNSIFLIKKNVAIDIHRREHGREVRDSTRAPEQKDESAQNNSRPILQPLADARCLIQHVPEFKQVDLIALQQALNLLEHQAKNAYLVIQYRYLSQPTIRSIAETAKHLCMRRDRVWPHEAHGFEVLRKHLRNESVPDESR